MSAVATEPLAVRSLETVAETDAHESPTTVEAPAAWEAAQPEPVTA